jgi:hypothetical protein
MSLSFLTPTVDVYLAGTTMGIGNVNASTINIGKTGTTINVGGLMNMTNTSTISANINSLSVSTLTIGGTLYTGPTTANQLINGSTIVTGSFINASNVSITNLSVAFINGTPYTGLGLASGITANVSSNMSFTNLSVTSRFVMPSTAYMNVSNASFTNVSFSTITGTLGTITTIYSAGFYSTSDFYLKENIEYIDNKYDINQLKPCTFNFINASTKKIGFIAQDVEQIIPESVIKGTGQSENTLNIDYSALLSVVVDSIKQINKKIDIMASKIEIIESIINK